MYHVLICDKNGHFTHFKTMSLGGAQAIAVWAIEAAVNTDVLIRGDWADQKASMPYHETFKS